MRTSRTRGTSLWPHAQTRGHYGCTVCSRMSLDCHGIVKSPACLSSATCGFRCVVGRHHVGRANLLLPITGDCPHANKMGCHEKILLPFLHRASAEVHGREWLEWLDALAGLTARLALFMACTVPHRCRPPTTPSLGSNLAVRHEACNVKRRQRTFRGDFEERARGVGSALPCRPVELSRRWLGPSRRRASTPQA